MRAAIVIALSAFAILGGCATAPPPAAAAPPTIEEANAEDTCGMARFRHLIGAPADQIDRAALPPGTRIITPDQMVTMDYSPQRLNIMTDTQGRVSSMRCF